MNTQRFVFGITMLLITSSVSAYDAVVDDEIVQDSTKTKSKTTELKG